MDELRVFVAELFLSPDETANAEQEPESQDKEDEALVSPLSQATTEFDTIEVIGYFEHSTDPAENNSDRAKPEPATSNRHKSVRVLLHGANHGCTVSVPVQVDTSHMRTDLVPENFSELDIDKVLHGADEEQTFPEQDWDAHSVLMMDSQSMFSYSSHAITSTHHNKQTTHLGMAASAKMEHALEGHERHPADTDPSAHRNIQPPQLFIELQSLSLRKQAWKEVSRWIKYEETVVAVGDKFDKPHVSMLSFHSLHDLRTNIDNGTLILDMHCTSFPDTIHKLADALITSKQMLSTLRQDFVRVMCLSHWHYYDPERWRAEQAGRRVKRNLRQTIRHAARTAHTQLARPLLEGGQEDFGNFQYSSPHIADNVPSRPNVSISSSGHNQDQSSIKESELEGAQLKGKRAQNANRRSALAKSFRRVGSASKRLIGSHMKAQIKESDKSELMQRLDEDCESALLFVGGVGFVHSQPITVLVRLAQPISMQCISEVPVPTRFIFVLLGPNTKGTEFKEMGRAMGSLMANETFKQTLYQTNGHVDLLTAFDEFLEDSIVLPPGVVSSPELVDFEQLKAQSKDVDQRRNTVRKTGPPKNDEHSAQQGPSICKRSGHIFGGAIAELKYRCSIYGSDITDAANWRCAQTICTVFFTCFVPAVTFGTILGETTKEIGVKETLLSTSVMGVFFGFFSAQPLLLIGLCGPILAFEISFFSTISYLAIDYLSARLCTAFWATLFCLLAVAVDAAVFISYVTPFADDCMSALIGLVFFLDSFSFLRKVFEHNQILSLYDYANQQEYSCSTTACNCSVLESLEQEILHRNDFNVYKPYQSCHQPNTAMLTASLVFGTFIIAWTLHQLRNVQMFGKTVRRALIDCSLTIAVLSMYAIETWVINDHYLTAKLRISPDFMPLDGNRSWMVSPFDLSLSALPVTVVAGFLLFLLVFLETEVCQMTLQEPRFKLKKGAGYHWDLLLSGLGLIICALFGCPWLCALPVRSMAHLSSLTECSKALPGIRPTIANVIEQRVTPIIISALIGLTTIPLVQLYWSRIPIAIFFGVFLYLGATTLNGNAMLSRALLILVPAKYHPRSQYTRSVRASRMHLYTCIQLGAFGLLLFVKSVKSIAVTFPVAFLVAVALRHLVLPLWFTHKELQALDGHKEENPVDASSF